jgi:hypothetical protein
MSSKMMFDIFKKGAEGDGHILTGMKQMDMAIYLGKRTIGPAQTYMAYWWRQSQRPILAPSEDICRAMMETEITITGKEINLPYRALYVHVPKSIGMKISNKINGELDADGVMACMVNEEMIFVVYGWPKVEGDIGNASFNRFVIPLDFDGDMESFLSRQDVRDKLDMLVGSGNGEDAIKWLRIVINSILYMESEGADVDSSPDLPDKKQARADRLTKRQREKYIEKHANPWSLVRIGHNLTIHEGIKKASGELRTRFIVRGHWRNQAHGPNRSLRKRKWIQPHWKGPEWAELMEGRVYQLETP